MPADWKDGDDIDETAAKEATNRMLEDPELQKAPGSPEDESTVDDPIEGRDE